MSDSIPSPRRERAQHPRQTILHETQFFTDEPNSLPHSPSSTAQILNARGPLLEQRRATVAVPFEHLQDAYPYQYGPYHVNGVSEPQLVHRKWTQEDQNEYDEKTRKKAMNGLVSSWMDRLQLISVITTFFAAIEAQLIGTTTPNDPTADSMIDQAANAALAGALVIHVFAAIISFLAAFFLIRYKLSVAKREERKIEGGVGTVSSSSVWSANPHLEQVGPFRRGTPPTHLLDHCHSLCMWLSAIGFALAIAGVMCFAWSRLALSASIFASVCCAACLVSGVAVVFWPASSMHKTKTA
ncbi:hypothetical protein GSI_04142 [Ganoderma sinense ZZ0214-1]|uniref:Uncharacterized protein n=1 Tax=Ganoderma sinense ZZ0214-1 TaxID=1077348 RepID=A0A2G8SIB9_9APHY|nr:hypothetical protein GSI_04142 [Ganoderma sinense ZZ0214-1]